MPFIFSSHDTLPIGYMNYRCKVVFDTLDTVRKSDLSKLRGNRLLWAQKTGLWSHCQMDILGKMQSLLSNRKIKKLNSFTTETHFKWLTTKLVHCFLIKIFMRLQYSRKIQKRARNIFTGENYILKVSSLIHLGWWSAIPTVSLNQTLTNDTNILFYLQCGIMLHI